ncbi:leucine-rich repeat protein [Treponema sp. R80B11-R83G3]
MAAYKNFLVKLSILIAVFIIVSLSGCLSEWQGDTAKIVISFGSAGRYAADDTDTHQKLKHEIVFTNASTAGKLEFSVNGGTTFEAYLAPGKWNVSVYSYLNDEENENIYAIGSEDVVLKLGQNNVIIKMFEALIVTFDAGEGKFANGESELKKPVPKGGKVEKPTSPTCGEIPFGGWYENDELTDIFDFSAEITKSITLYARWDNSEPDADTFYSIADFKEWFEAQQPNTPRTAYNVKLNISDLGPPIAGTNSPSELGSVLKTNSDKYVNLDLSQSTFGPAIDSNAFRSCTNLTSVIIPSTVHNMGTYVFAECTSLTSVTIPAAVYTIGDYAFSGCTSLTGITIPASVGSIYPYAFSGCTKLTIVTFSTGSSITLSNFLENAFPQDSTGAGGDNLKNAYLNANTGGAGTYIRESGGSIWTKQGSSGTLVDRVSFNQNTSTVTVGSTISLNAIVEPSSATH